MRRRNPLVQELGASATDQQEHKQSSPKERRLKRHTRPSGLVNAAFGHPLFGFVLFLIIFPGSALFSALRELCRDGDLPGCRQNNPAPVLVRSSQSSLYLPNWRLDGRCGSQFPSTADQHSSICDPFSKSPCCSQWGWCGSGSDYCTQAVKAPYNHSGTGEACTLHRPLLHCHEAFLLVS